MRMRKVSNKVTAILGLQVFLGALIFFFGNCTSQHTGTGSQSSGSKTINFGNCSLTGPDHLFSMTYHPILTAQCATCHVAGGRGKGVFASSSLPIAFDAFSLVGYRRISEFAVDQNHQSPYTGAHNIAAINEATQNWRLGVEELEKCKTNTIEEFVDDPWNAVRVHTKSKAINATNTGSVTVTWDMNTDLLVIPAGVSWPTLPGAKFELTFTPTFNGANPSYSISRPRITYPVSNTQAVDINLESIRVKINGDEVINETTFHYVNANVYKNVSTLLSAGAMVSVGDIRKSDVVSVSFGRVRIVTLPPPPPVPSVQFTTTSSTNAETGKVTVTVQLSEAVDSFVSVGYSTTTPNVNGAKPSCCSSITDTGGQTVQVKNFDRDFKKTVNDGGTLVFNPNQVSKTVEIDIYPDQRDEPNEIINLTIDSVSIGNGDGQLGTNKEHRITITDNDNAPAADEVTFSLLMSPGGAFSRYCVHCHHSNSDDVLAREYDMTTYEDLLLSNRVVPLKPDNSILWWRIRGYDNLNKTVSPMPQNGLFDTDGKQAKDDIYDWIIRGAKNN